MLHDTPDHSSVEIELTPLTNEQFLAVAIKAAGRLGWEISEIHENGLLINSKPAENAAAAVIKILIDDAKAYIYEENDREMIKSGANGSVALLYADAISAQIQGLSEEEIELAAAELRKEFEENGVEDESEESRRRRAYWKALFKPDGGVFITLMLIVVNCLVLLFASGFGFSDLSSAKLISWGANYTPLTLDGEIWRLLASCFLHGGFLHLLMNMYALFFIGQMLEPFLGGAKFLLCYLLTGLLASLVSLWWHPITLSVGASGAVFGMYGVMLALILTSSINKVTRKDVLSSILLFIAFNLLYGMKEGIDNAAHAGGLASGIILGTIIGISERKPDNKYIASLLFPFVCAVLLAGAFFTYRAIPRDILIYETRMNSFASMERRALEILKNTGQRSAAGTIREINNYGIPAWKEMIDLLNSTDKMRLPEIYHKRNAVLIKYCDLRMKSYQLIVRSYLEHDPTVNDSMQIYGRMIDSVLARFPEDN